MNPLTACHYNTERFASDLDRLDRSANQMLEHLVAWSNINSGSDNIVGLQLMAQRIQALFAPLAQSSQVIELPDGQQLDDDGQLKPVRYGPLLTFAQRPEAPIQVLLTGHMDTVFPSDSAFQSAHFTDDGKLHGPGVADMKGGLLVMFMALAAWEATDQAHQIGWRVVINPDEETGSLASAQWLTRYAKTADLGLVFEPALADGTLAGERKGSGNFSIRVTGKSAHAGREFHKGRNAVVAAAKITTGLHDINRLAQDYGVDVTLNIGRITGGGPVNVVPDCAVVHFNVRLSDDQSQGWVREQIDRVMASVHGQPHFRAELFGQFTRPAKKNTPAHQLLCDWLQQSADSLQVPIAFKATGGCCDGNNLAAAGLPNIDTLGVRGGQIHTDQEFMVIESLAERAKLCFLLLTRVSDQGQLLKQLSAQARLTTPQQNDSMSL